MTNLYNAVSHASSRRPIALRNEDYDHEISLIDHTDLSRIGSRSVDISRSDGDSITPQSTNTTGTRRHSYDHGKHGSKIRNNIEHKRWSKKWTEERLGERAGQLIPTDVESDHGVTPTTSSNLRIVVTEDGDDENGRHSPPKQGTVITSMTIDRTPTSPTLESAIDVLYENQRGGFLCGLPLFGSRALGWFDAAPWTNIAFKPSATSIKNAQVPDPSWEWTGPDWVVNQDPDNEALDDEGWEYSFMFSNSFSWHGPNWYSSFVRRRAWIRKRVRTQPDRLADDPVRLTAEYFTVHAERPLSASISASPRSSRLETTRPEPETTDKARGIEQMLLALKECRIDREKIEVVEAFVKRADEDLGELASRMHEVMRMFIFQASRRTLHVHLTAVFDEESARNKEVEENDEVANTKVGWRKRRLAHLLKAIDAADEEVKRLEYWSDIKGVTEDGVVKHAVDQDHGWDPAWRGLDTSSPRDVITEAQMPGVDEGPAKRAEELLDRRPSTSDSKGKGKKKLLL